MEDGGVSLPSQDVSGPALLIVIPCLPRTLLLITKIPLKFYIEEIC